jgi:salicylate hydroxylase
MNTPLPILISGAGIGGLTAALALQQRGVPVRVFEQARELREVGAGLQVSPNAWRALASLGLASALDRIAAYPDGKIIRLWNTGQRWSLFDLGDHAVSLYGHPYCMVYRPDLHGLLADAVRERDPQAISLGQQVVRFEDTAIGVRVIFADGSSTEGAALIGADGVHSRIREQLFGEDKPHFSGCLAWRGVIPMERLPERLRERVGANWVGPGAHVIHYPLRGGALMNFVGIVERSDWQVESWNEQGTHAECHADFAQWHDEIHTFIDAIEQPFKWALMARQPLQRWTRGNVTLLGDACHPTLPFLAQGAAMAIEDGLVLGRCIAQFKDNLPEALTRYKSARIERTTQIVERSTENGRRFHNPALASAEGAADYVSREWAEDKVRQRYDWLFRYCADEVEI